MITAERWPAEAFERRCRRREEGMATTKVFASPRLISSEEVDQHNGAKDGFGRLSMGSLSMGRHF